VSTLSDRVSGGLEWTYIDERARDFTGRLWLFLRIRQLLAGPPGRLVLSAGPGSGKTAVAARLAQAAFRPSSVGRQIPDYDFVRSQSWGNYEISARRFRTQAPN
jgi:hypothetical protein